MRYSCSNIITETENQNNSLLRSKFGRDLPMILLTNKYDKPKRRKNEKNN